MASLTKIEYIMGFFTDSSQINLFVFPTSLSAVYFPLTGNI